MPPVTLKEFDLGPVRDQLKREAPQAELLAPGYLDPLELL
jgi:hypothetical protein